MPWTNSPGGGRNEASNLIEPDADNVSLTIGFGSLGNSADYKLSGWQEPEHGFSWSAGSLSAIAFPCPEAPGTYALELTVSPFIWGDKLTAQRLIVTINDEEVGTFEIDHETILICAIPWRLLSQRGACMVEFHLPDTARPSEISGVPDTRSIAVAFHEIRLIRQERPLEGREALGSSPTQAKVLRGRLPEQPVTDLARKDLMMRFESLGEDCEFGLVQRRCGAEPLGLLRFSSTPLPRLIAALDAKFDGLGRPDLLNVEVSSNGREYMVSDKRFGLYYHAWVLAGEKSPEEIHARECGRLPFLARKLIEDLQEGRKTFVYRGMSPLAENEVLDLLTALRAYGPTTLLWVEAADNAHAAGSVEELANGLLRGNIERFAPPQNAHDFSLDAWIEVCHNADCLRAL